MNKKPIEFSTSDMVYMHDEYDIHQKIKSWENNLTLIVPKKCYIGVLETEIRPIFEIYDSYGVLITNEAFKSINPTRYKYFQASFQIEGVEYPDVPPIFLVKDFPLTTSKMNSLIAIFNYIHGLETILEIETIEKILETPTVDTLKEKLSCIAVFNSDYLDPEPNKLMPSYHKIRQMNILLEDRVTYLVADSNEFGSQINEKCLIELFGKQRTFCSHKTDNKKAPFVTGWEKLLIHLGIVPPYPDPEDPEDFELDCKDRLQSMGVKFPEDIF